MFQQKSFTSARYFVLHDYCAGDGGFALRSSKGGEYSYNIDIIFFDTRFIQVHSMLYGVNLYKHEPVATGININIRYPTVKEYLKDDYKQLFYLESNEETYYIAASDFLVFENQLEFNQSGLDFSPGTLIASSNSKLGPLH
jgi:hypothetical protein